MDSIYVGAVYLYIENCKYIRNKYNEVPSFILEDLVINKLGVNWEEDQQQIVNSFRDRMFWQNKIIANIDEPILFGKMFDKGSAYMIPEIVLLSEIALNYSIDEMDKLINNNKVKIKKV